MLRTRKSNKLNKQKNKFRGLVADIKSSAFRKGSNKDPAYKFSRGIKALYLDSKLNLSHSEFQPFLEWVETQVSKSLPETNKIDRGYSELAGVIRNDTRCDLETELLWVTELLYIHKKEINFFREVASKVEVLIYEDEIERSIDLLKSLELLFGGSFWGHQLRVSLEYNLGGLEQQKLYVAEVRNQMKRGLLNFVSYYTSIRNEEKTTLHKFNEDLNSRLSRHKFYDDVDIAYLQFRLGGKLSEPTLSDVLYIEQSHHIFDLYETFIAICQYIVKSNNLSKYESIVTKCFTRLKEINDFRISKVLYFFNNTKNVLSPRTTEVSDLLLAGLPSKALIAFNRLSVEKKIDPWNQIYKAFSYGQFKNIKIDSYNVTPKYIPLLIARLLIDGANKTQSILDSINKVSLNYSAVSSVHGIREFVCQLTQNDSVNFFEPYYIGLNSKSYGTEDCSKINILEATNSLTDKLWNSFYNSENVEAGHFPDKYIATIFIANSLALEEKYDLAAKSILRNGKITSRPLWNLSTIFLLNIYHQKNDINNLVKLIAVEGVKALAPFPLAHIIKFIGSRQWKEFANVSDPIIACVAIHILWKQDESPETASMLRFSIRQCIKKYGVSLPSELILKKRETPLRVWNYFFREVCKPSFIDQLVRGSNQLLKERSSICSNLCSFDHENLDLYEAEITEIASSLAKDQGKIIINQTRIHVDHEGLKRWAIKELSEDYSRYHDLLDVSVKASFEEEFNEIFYETIEKGGKSESWKRFDKNTEADMVFISVLAQLSEEFLISSEFGLDFYLSKRVRHQSFIGLIRGPLEFEHLITTKDKFGCYHSNDFWLSKLYGLPVEKRTKIDSELTKFAVKFDNLLEIAKNKYFQISSTDNPKGLIKLEVNEQAVFLLKMITHKVDGFPDFIDVAISVFWGGLSKSLKQVMNYISLDLKQSIHYLFEELISGIKKYDCPNNSEVQALLHKIKDCSLSVQRELDTSAMWFSRSDVEEITNNTFEAEQLLEIAIESTLKCHQVFHPLIVKDVVNPSKTLFDTSTLVFVHDVMFVALDNIYKHSNITEPNIKIVNEINKNTYSIEITSDFRPVDLLVTEEKLNEIRALIKSKKFERRTRKEGGSGLLKIAAVALQQPEGDIQFSVTDQEFTMKVTYLVLTSKISKDKFDA